MHDSEDAGIVYLRAMWVANLVEEIVRISPTPVCGTIETHLGRGIVGGSIASLEAQGQRAAQLAFRVLSGERAEPIPVQPPPPPAPMVDWRQLRKWGLSEGSLPAGSRVLFRPPSLWREYRSYVVGALVVLGVQRALIGALLAQNRRRRLAEQGSSGIEPVRVNGV